MRTIILRAAQLLECGQMNKDSIYNDVNFSLNTHCPISLASFGLDLTLRGRCEVILTLPDQSRSSLGKLSLLAFSCGKSMTVTDFVL